MARISLISRNFPPLSGGMERLVHQLYSGLVQQHQVTLFGPQGCADYAGDAEDVYATAVSPTPMFLLKTLCSGIAAQLAGKRPEIVIGGSGLVGPVVILLAKLAGAKSIVLLHGLDIIADSRIYQRVFVPFLRRADVALCNSNNTARLAMQHGIEKRRITVINPGVDANVELLAQDAAKAELGAAGRRLLLSVGRLMPRKGLVEFIEQSFAELAANDASLLLLIAGSEPANALNKPDYSVQAAIEAAIETHQLQNHVKLLGQVDEQTLALLYGAADVFVFPLLATPGDVEGFGMVAIEAAIYGTPTVAFDCGGVGDAVADGVNGALVPAGDYAAFSAAIERVLEQDLRQSSQDFAAQFSWENYLAKFATVIARLVAA